MGYIETFKSELRWRLNELTDDEVIDWASRQVLSTYHVAIPTRRDEGELIHQSKIEGRPISLPIKPL